MSEARRGRPPLPPDQRKSEWVTVRLTPGEADAVARQAVQERMSLSDTVRWRMGLGVFGKSRAA